MSPDDNILSSGGHIAWAAGDAIGTSMPQNNPRKKSAPKWGVPVLRQ
jgi:hypothetical protein